MYIINVLIKTKVNKMAKRNQHEALIKRTDLWQVDPRVIKVKEGWNKREDFGDIDELSKSIVENGVLIPITILKNKDADYELIDGERRLRATLFAIENGYDIQTIPAKIQKSKDEIGNLFVQILSNEGKRFTPIEEARVYEQLVVWGVNISEIASRVGKSVPHVYNRLKLCKATPEVKEALKNKEITIGVATKIADESYSVVEQSNKLKQAKSNVKQKVKRNLFSLDKITIAINKEFSKFKKNEKEHTKKDKVNAINNLKKLIIELEKNIS
jgi:ParB family chromosome partitioning protein